MASPLAPASQQTRALPPSHALVSSPSFARPVATAPSSSSSADSSRQTDEKDPRHSRAHSQSPFRYVPALQQHARMLSGGYKPLHDAQASAALPMNTFGRAVASAPALKPSSPCDDTRSIPLYSPTPIDTGGRHHTVRSSPQPHAAASTPGWCHSPALLAHAPPRSLSLMQPTPQMRRLLLRERLKPWVPFIMYAFTSLGFVFVITLYKVEVFQALDDLSSWLREEEYVGYAILYSLIFLTTIPPFPLYSTLTVLSGYTYGAWTGAVISYFAALSGALFVFMLSRTYFRSSINRCLSHTGSLKRAVRAIERRPKLLFLVRLAPYPYNVMNALLAGSPTLSLRTYTACTALSLCKVIIHTSVGASIHSFAEYHGEGSESSGNSQSGLKDGEQDGWLGRTSTVAGIALCVALAVYLGYIARKAVDEELEADAMLESGLGVRLDGRDDSGTDAYDEDEDDADGADERVAFLRSTSYGREMVERDRARTPPSAGLYNPYPFLERSQEKH